MTSPSRQADDQKEEDRKLIRRIDDHGKNLSRWEVDFVASCLDQLGVDLRGSALSGKQRKIAERIDEEKVS